MFFSTSRSVEPGAVIARAAANLGLITGNVGKASAGVNPLRSDANSQGATDMGCVPSMLPGHVSLGSDAPLGTGLSYGEMVQGGGESGLRALFVSLDSQRETPDLDADALSSLDFLVVHDLFFSDAARAADVVLPAASFAEKDGTFTNGERRVQRVNRVVERIGESMTVSEVVGALAARMGTSGFGHESPAKVMEEISSVVPAYGGISYDRLGVVGLQWPCPDASEHPGTPVLHSDGIVRGKGLLSAFEIWALHGRLQPRLPDSSC